jgi:hypothetical protein
MPGPRLAILSYERRDIDSDRLRPVVHEHDPMADKRWPAVDGANDHAVARGLDLELAPRDEVKLIAERLGDDEPAGGINGSFHARMVTRMGFTGKAGVYWERRAKVVIVLITWSMWASVRPG